MNYSTSWRAIALLIALSAITAYLFQNASKITPYESYVVRENSTEQHSGPDEGFWLTLGKTETIYAVVSAYNPVPEQTNGDPCISANGTDICAGMADGFHYAASNNLPMGSYVLIERVVYEIVDRTAERYGARIDIAFPADKIQEARNWGLQMLEVGVWKNL